MSLLAGVSTLSYADLYASFTENTGPWNVGDLQPGPGGRWFRLALVGASALVAGNLIQAAGPLDSTYINMAVGTAGAVGDKFIQVTNGTSTVTSQQFEGGTIGVYTAGTVAIGDEYIITSVTGTLTTGGALSVFVDRPLRYAFTTSAKVNMIRSPWSGVIQMPASTPTDMCVGGALFALPATSYGWVQTHGMFTALSDGQTQAIGSDLTATSATAGSVSVYAAGTGKQRIGTSRAAAALAHGIPIFLQID